MTILILRKLITNIEYSWIIIVLLKCKWPMYDIYSAFKMQMADVWYKLVLRDTSTHYTFISDYVIVIPFLKRHCFLRNILCVHISCVNQKYLLFYEVRSNRLMTGNYDPSSLTTQATILLEQFFYCETCTWKFMVNSCLKTDVIILCCM